MPKKPLFKKTVTNYTLIICVGLVLIGSGSVMQNLGIESHIMGFTAGAGCALVGLGAIGLIILHFHPKSVEQQKIDNKDERNIKIREKSAYGAYAITSIAMGVAILVFVALNNMEACFIITMVLAVHTLSYLILMFVNNKKL